MTVATTPARRLLALLEDEQALEARPLEDVLADLDAHGVDAAAAIRLARRLAERSRGPAAALLGAVIEDEAAEAEIAALEAASIDDVRGRLDAGTVAAVAAEAKRRAGLPSNVVGLGRRRSAAWTWAGSLVGMAACALIVVAVWWPADQGIAPAPEVALMEVEPPSADAAADTDSLRTQPEIARTAPLTMGSLGGAERDEPHEPAAQMAPAQDQPAVPAQRLASSDLAPTPEPEVPPEAAEERQSESPSVVMAEPIRRAGGPRAVSAAPTEAEDPVIAGSRADEVQARGDAVAASEQPAPPLPPRPPAQAATSAPTAEMAMNAPAEPPQIITGGAGEAAGSAESEVRSARTEEWIEALQSGEPARGLAVAPNPADQLASAFSIVEILVVDPLIAPSQAVPAFADDYRGRGLAVAPLSGRLADARAAADGRHLVALMTVQEAAETYDVAIVLRDPAAAGPPPGARDPLLAMVYGDRAEVFERIRLPPRPPE